MAEPSHAQLEQRAEVLKERVYVTFSALAVAMALRAEAAHLTVGAAAAVLTVSILGTLLAVLLAEVVAHITVHQALPDRAEVRHLLVVGAAALGVLVLPLVLMGAAALRVLTLPIALDGATAVLALTLVAVGFLAVRRLRLPLGQRLLVLLGEAALGAAVVGLELLAH